MEEGRRKHKHRKKKGEKGENVITVGGQQYDLDIIPDDILYDIACRLDINSMVKFSAVNKRVYEIFNDHQFFVDCIRGKLDYGMRLDFEARKNIGIYNEAMGFDEKTQTYNLIVVGESHNGMSYGMHLEMPVYAYSDELYAMMTPRERLRKAALGSGYNAIKIEAEDTPNISHGVSSKMDAINGLHDHFRHNNDTRAIRVYGNVWFVPQESKGEPYETDSEFIDAAYKLMMKFTYRFQQYLFGQYLKDYMATGNVAMPSWEVVYDVRFPDGEKRLKFRARGPHYDSISGLLKTRYAKKYLVHIKEESSENEDPKEIAEAEEEFVISDAMQSIKSAKDDIEFNMKRFMSEQIDQLIGLIRGGTIDGTLASSDEKEVEKCNKLTEDAVELVRQWDSPGVSSRDLERMFSKLSDCIGRL